jgi:hypothetical protein
MRTDAASFIATSRRFVLLSGGNRRCHRLRDRRRATARQSQWSCRCANPYPHGYFDRAAQATWLPSRWQVIPVAHADRLPLGAALNFKRELCSKPAPGVAGAPGRGAIALGEAPVTPGILLARCPKVAKTAAREGAPGPRTVAPGLVVPSDRIAPSRLVCRGCRLTRRWHAGCSAEPCDANRAHTSIIPLRRRRPTDLSIADEVHKTRANPVAAGFISQNWDQLRQK